MVIKSHLYLVKWFFLNLYLLNTKINKPTLEPLVKKITDNKNYISLPSIKKYSTTGI